MLKSDDGPGTDDEPGIDLTPMIDVIFMLIIFFVMSMTFSRPVLDIVLPDSETSERARENRTLTIEVTASGDVRHEGKTLSEAALRALVSELSDEVTLTLAIDRAAPFRSFVTLVDLAKTHCGGRFVITTGKAEP